jgi:hypothetical protein
LSSAQLLTDAERWALEDVLGDLIELEATVGAVSVGLLHAHPVALQVRTVLVASCQALAWPVSRSPWVQAPVLLRLSENAVQARKLVALSERLPSDESFARQIKRKCLPLELW